MNHPDAQRKIQAELDTITGEERFPDFDEGGSSLTYLSACIKVCFRWNQVASHLLYFLTSFQFERNARGAAFGYGAGDEWLKNHVRMSVDVDLIVPLFLSSGYT